jgi:hypothetical protein
MGDVELVRLTRETGRALAGNGALASPAWAAWTHDQATRRADSSTSTISSRTTMPLPKVTTRAPSSMRVAVTKPGTSRVWSAPTSRSASQAFSGRVRMRASLRIEAMGSSSCGEKP